MGIAHQYYCRIFYDEKSKMAKYIFQDSSRFISPGSYKLDSIAAGIELVTYTFSCTFNGAVLSLIASFCIASDNYDKNTVL